MTDRRQQTLLVLSCLAISWISGPAMAATEGAMPAPDRIVELYCAGQSRLAARFGEAALRRRPDDAALLLKTGLAQKDAGLGVAAFVTLRRAFENEAADESVEEKCGERTLYAGPIRRVAAEALQALAADLRALGVTTSDGVPLLAARSRPDEQVVAAEGQRLALKRREARRQATAPDEKTSGSGKPVQSADAGKPTTGGSPPGPKTSSPTEGVLAGLKRVASEINGESFVQIGSYRKLADARIAWGEAHSDFSDLAAKKPVVWRATLSNKRTYFRLGVKMKTRLAAEDLCAKLRAGAQSCQAISMFGLPKTAFMALMPIRKPAPDTKSINPLDAPDIDDADRPSERNPLPDQETAGDRAA